jgi:hypothetical protein
MSKDIRFLLIFLIIALAALVYLQSQNSTVIPNQGAVKLEPFYEDRTQAQNNFDTNKHLDTQTKSDLKSLKKISTSDNTSIIQAILSNNTGQSMNATQNDRFDNLINQELLSQNSEFSNPLLEDVNNDGNSMSSDQQALDELIKEVNTGNDLLVDSPQAELYRNKSKSIDSAPKGTYRKVSYKDSEYRTNFDNDSSPSQDSQNELNSLYDDALIFRNNEYTQNSDFTGFTDEGSDWGDANLKNFTPSGKQTQQDKIMSLYNSNEYLPNNDLLDNKLTKGFQILENPVSVSNPNLIPVLKSIPVSSVLGSKRNSTWDIRSEPPNPKTVVSPFLNSSIMPDIYATQRGCL